jgi:hypothetical protein
MKKIIIFLLLLVNISMNSTNLTNLELQRKYAKKSIINLIRKNTEYFFKTVLNEEDIKIIKDYAATSEGLLYASFLSSFDLRGCKSIIGRAYILSNDPHHFKANDTAYINERDENDEITNNNSYNQSTTSIYLNTLCNHGINYSMSTYDKSKKAVVMGNPRTRHIFFIKDEKNNKLIQLKPAQSIALRKKYLSVHFVCKKERKEELMATI